MIIDNQVQLSESIVSIDIEIEAGDVAPSKAPATR